MSTTYKLSQSLTKQLIEIFEGTPWHGDSLMTKLRSVRKEADTPQLLNKTASYVQHLINWRQFVIKKLEGESTFDIQLNTISDWTDINIEQFSDWDLLITRLTQSQERLLDLIKTQSDVAMKSFVPGKKYPLEHMLHGLIQHDVYHTGQIAVYWKNK